MAVFPIAGLASHLLEKIITKMEEKSYFRLRQTCRGMNEFIRKSQNISVQVDGIHKVKCLVNFHRLGEDRRRHLDTMFRLAYSKYDYVIDIENLYGTRLAAIHFLDVLACNFDQHREAAEEFIDSLRENRVTCEILNLSKLNCTEEDCTTLLNILKPIGVKIEDRGHYELLFQLKTLKFVNMHFSVKTGRDEEQIANAARNFFSTCEEVEFSVYYVSDVPQPFHVLRTVLEILFSPASAKLREMELDVERKGIPVAKDDFEKLFRDFFNYTLEDETEDYFIARMELPQQFPPGSHCKMEVQFGEDFHAVIYFNCGQE